MFFFRLRKYQSFLKEQQKAQAGGSNVILDYYDPVSKFDRKQQSIRKALVTGIVDCALPLSIVEHEAFRDLITECQPKFNHLTR